MDAATADFSLAVQGVRGLCPAGERYAKEQIARKTIPVLSCEGPCIRGEIARLVANLIAQEHPRLARACHAETFFVPHSAMAAWVRGADKSVMLDGCFLKCHGRVLNNLVGVENVLHIDARPSTGNTPTSSRWTTCRKRNARLLHATPPTRSSRS
jgi:uncharacterized metal-binding protein